MAWYNRGVALRNLGRYEQAIASYDQALQIKPDDSGAWYNRGVALGNLGRYEEEIASYDQALQIKPDDSGAWYNRGVALGNLGRYEEEIASYDQALQIKPDSYEVWVNRGVALGNLGRYEEAIASYDQALQIKPDDYMAWGNRGNALCNLGRNEEAIASYDQAVQIKPDDYMAWYNRGVALRNLGRYEEEIASYDQALQIKPDYFEAWSNRGLALLNLSRYEEAIASYDQAVQIKPDDFEAWNNRGVALLGLGRYEEAIASCDQALQIKPDYSEAWGNRGVALCNLGRYEEAIASYDQALQIKPDYSVAWYNRGVALCNLGRYEEAIASYDQALQIKPDSYEVWVNRGVALGNLGRNEEAIAFFDQALQIKPDESVAWNNRGNAALKSSRHTPIPQQTFSAFFQRSLEQSPQHLTALLDPTHPEKLYQQFPTSLTQSKTLLRDHFPQSLATSQQQLRSTFADSPSILERLNQPPSPQLQAFLNSTPTLNTPTPEQLDNLKAFIRRLPSVEVIQQIQATAQKHYSLTHPELNERGYPGKINSLEFPLKQGLIRPDTHPEGFGILHHQLGKAHYKQGLTPAAHNQRFPYFDQAKTHYETALQTLTFATFPEQRLKVLSDLITVCFRLRQDDTATNHLRTGIIGLERLLENKTPSEKERLTREFSPFFQLEVEEQIRAQNYTEALEIAEKRKNFCLQWFQTPPTPLPFAHLQQHLCTPHTAIIYWHLSPVSLATFLILPQGTPQLISHLTDTDYNTLTHWIKEWNNNYTTYHTQPPKERQNAPWRRELPQQLDQLQTLLQIPTLSQNLRNHDIQTLILIPHRDLHRFPLSTFFPLPSFYLPSAALGLRETRYTAPLTSLNLIENPKSTPTVNHQKKALLDLPYAEIEAALLRQQFPQGRTLANNATTQEQVNQLLTQPAQILHFCGHGAYNSQQPKQSCLFLKDEDCFTIEDILRQDLTPYDLVSLAACETAITGNEAMTEEYVGLVSAFLQVGATFVLSTLWSVDSFPTSLFIVQFYHFLQDNPPPFSPPTHSKLAKNRHSSRTLYLVRNSRTPTHSTLSPQTFEHQTNGTCYSRNNHSSLFSSLLLVCLYFGWL